MDWLNLLAVPGSLKSLLQHHSSKASILQHSAFFKVQLSHPYMTTGKTIALTRRTFVGKVMSLLLNMLSRLVITFLPLVYINITITFINLTQGGLSNLLVCISVKSRGSVARFRILIVHFSYLLPQFSSHFLIFVLLLDMCFSIGDNNNCYQQFQINHLGRNRTPIRYNFIKNSKFSFICLTYVCVGSHSVMSSCLHLFGRVLSLGDSPGKTTGVGCHFLFQGIFPTQGSNPHLLCLLHCRQILYLLNYWGSPFLTFVSAKSLQFCPTLCDPMDCSPPGSSVHGISQARDTGVSCHFIN